MLSRIAAPFVGGFPKLSTNDDNCEESMVNGMQYMQLIKSTVNLEGITHHTLNWTASTDKLQIGCYAIYRNGKIISAVRGVVTTFDD